MRSQILRSMLAGLVLIAMTAVIAGDASAQCATCPQPVVAYQPVVAQPTVAYAPYTYNVKYKAGWLERWRARRAGVNIPRSYTATYAPALATAPAYTAAYAPGYTAAYAPSYTTNYTAAYAPAYQPYVTAYAPLSRPVVQTVSRQVVMRPVVAAPACNACSYTPSCGGCSVGCDACSVGCDTCSVGCDACSSGCDACATSVSQATYSEPACASCAAGSVTSVLPQVSSSSVNVGPQTPQPSYTPAPAPAPSQYESQRPAQKSETSEATDDADPLDKFDPGPTQEGDSSTYFNAPRLLDPRDRTARSFQQRSKPTVDVWTAVYRGAANSHKASQTSNRSSAKPKANSRSRTQAEIDAEGWTAVQL
jgi:hypothetical protein